MRILRNGRYANVYLVPLMYLYTLIGLSIFYSFSRIHTKYNKISSLVNEKDLTHTISSSSELLSNNSLFGGQL